MAKKAKTTSVKRSKFAGYDTLLSEVVDLLEQARRGAARVVNCVMTTTYWQVGQRIVEHEQHGEERAEYGEQLLSRLSIDLTHHLGKGFSRQNLQSMRSFYLMFPSSQICQTSSGELTPEQICQTPSGKSIDSIDTDLPTLSAIFPLPWSHYVRLLSVKDSDGRQFYESESLRGGWTVKQLDRQISTQFYERTMLSKNKARMLTKHNQARPEDVLTVEEQIKDPFVLEFLGLKDEYSESELEASLITKLEQFLLELGGDFAFIGRQKRLRIGETWYRVDLLFFHRRLRCLVVIDLKVGKFTHADAGQMHLYVNYAQEHWATDGENPPVGLILCTEKDAAVAHYALDNLKNKVLAAEYRMRLPREKQLAAELVKTRRLLERRHGPDARATN